LTVAVATTFGEAITTKTTWGWKLLWHIVTPCWS
jgi:hypothetical protein